MSSVPSSPGLPPSVYTPHSPTGPRSASPAAPTPETPAAPAADSNHAVTPGQTPIQPSDVNFPAQGTAATATAFASEFPEGIPESTKITYTDLSQRLKANPKVNYIEIDRQDLNQGLKDYLNQYSEMLLSDDPQMQALVEKLKLSEAGQNLLDVLQKAQSGEFLGTDDIIKLQTFLVASGIDISHKNSSTGIDGDYGPKTHAAMQQAFASLLNAPDESFTQFDANFSRAYASAQQQRADRTDMGNSFVPGQNEFMPSDVVSDIDLPSSTSTGDQLVAAARQTQPQMARTLAALQAKSGRRHYRCYQGVKLALNQINPPMSLTGGSAYMATDQLKSKYADRFSNIHENLDPNAASTKALLRNLPKGAIVVWDRNPSASKRRANPNNGYSHGHISIAMGGGQEYSDRYRSQIMNNDGRYGGVTIFIPK